MAWDLSCTDWWDRLEHGMTPIPPLPIDDKLADQAVNVFDYLRVPDIPEQPRMEDAAADWVRDIIRASFGSLKDGVRHVGEVFLMVPKKNTKTTTAAAIALTFMLLNERANADMLIIGPTQKIAEVAYAQAVGMIRADDERYLQDRFQVQEAEQTIKCRVTHARLMIRTFGPKVLTGCKPVFVLVDEVHILGTIGYAAAVMRQIRGGMYPFEDSLFLMITTQSDEPPAGVFKSELEYARNARDGKLPEDVAATSNLLAVLYEFPLDMQEDKEKPWLDPELWALVTPNLDRSVTLDTLKRGFARAQHEGEHELVAWASQHLNLQIGLAIQAGAWRGAVYWQQASRRAFAGLDDVLEAAEVVTLGIDGGGLDDLMGASVVARLATSKKWVIWGHALAHMDVIAQRPEIETKLRDFEDAGHLTFVSDDDPTADIEWVADLAKRLWEARLLPEVAGIGLDPMGVGSIIDAIEAADVPLETMVAVPQGAKLSRAVWTAERKLKDGSLVHGGQALMAWVVGNARAEQRGNATYISKQMAGKAKIDPLIAVFNAIDLMSRNPVARPTSVYTQMAARAAHA